VCALSVPGVGGSTSGDLGAVARQAGVIPLGERSNPSDQRLRGVVLFGDGHQLGRVVLDQTGDLVRDRAEALRRPSRATGAIGLLAPAKQIARAFFRRILGQPRSLTWKWLGGSDLSGERQRLALSTSLAEVLFADGPRAVARRARVRATALIGTPDPANVRQRRTWRSAGTGIITLTYTLNAYIEGR
jgi:hypothetical protein